jgi:hypothetical protein
MYRGCLEILVSPRRRLTSWKTRVMELRILSAVCLSLAKWSEVETNKEGLLIQVRVDQRAIT